MLNIPAIRNLIREKKEFQIHSTMMTHAKLGMQTMDQCLRDRYIDRLITLETALAHAGNVGNLQRLISAAATHGVDRPQRSGARAGKGMDEDSDSYFDGASIGV